MTPSLCAGGCREPWCVALLRQSTTQVVRPSASAGAAKPAGAAEAGRDRRKRWCVCRQEGSGVRRRLQRRERACCKCAHSAYRTLVVEEQVGERGGNVDGGGWGRWTWTWCPHPKRRCLGSPHCEGPLSSSLFTHAGGAPLGPPVPPLRASPHSQPHSGRECAFVSIVVGSSPPSQPCCSHTTLFHPRAGGTRL